MITEPCISFHPNKVVLFTKILEDNGKPFRRAAPVIMPKSNATHGNMSKKAAKQIREKVNWLVEKSKKQKVTYPNGNVSHNFRICFITLTLPSKQMHSDLEIKKLCLNQFLTELRQRYNMVDYVWKAEIQKNENIHFHITTNVFLDHRQVRSMWNRIINKLGYVSNYSRSMRRLSFNTYQKIRLQGGNVSDEQIAKAWNLGQSNYWNNPNSTDVRTVFKVDNLAAYLAKYLSKKVASHDHDKKTMERVLAFGGRLWYCSQSLSRLKGYVTLQCNKAMDFFSWLSGSVKQRILEFDYCNILYLDRAALPPPLQKEYKRLMGAYIHNQLALA